MKIMTYCNEINQGVAFPDLIVIMIGDKIFEITAGLHEDLKIKRMAALGSDTMKINAESPSVIHVE